ncbi:phosphatidylinositol 4-phosphate 5-kinase 1-like, partial [Ceratina calcarata]|uniref:Phosphatidylinositol 4-phosphate 5-kinase 1-like n=1 Tax=Ceratina calcarata TaxID=156304 RepID=A0AAJ7WCT0_9HYME
YSRYGNGGSYDGDWLMDKMHGVGLRIYPSGSRYIGDWKNGVRDGTGTMVWPEGSIYRGEWKCGAMNGYGKHVWNGFFNKTFTWPQEASYKGYWQHGKRHGRGNFLRFTLKTNYCVYQCVYYSISIAFIIIGEIKLNAVGGAKYCGYWKNNEKDGYGVIIGSNGEKFESGALFLNNILSVSDNPENETKSETKTNTSLIVYRFLNEPEALTDIPATPILKPEQFPCLFYYITRLLDPDSLNKSSVLSITSGKCYSCENELCSCLAHPIGTGYSFYMLIIVILKYLKRTRVYVCTETIDSEQKEPSTRRNSNLSSSNDLSTDSNYWKFEEQWIYNCITLHMPRLRKIYNDYAKLFVGESPNYNLKMIRLYLWQLWRDCGIHKKGLGLNEIDNHIGI